MAPHAEPFPKLPFGTVLAGAEARAPAEALPKRHTSVVLYTPISPPVYPQVKRVFGSYFFKLQLLLHLVYLDPSAVNSY
jgi:hypothetical protein